MTWPFEPLRPLSYDLIVADPPWTFDLYSEAGAEKSASAHYDCMETHEIAALPVGQLAGGNCLLLCWATAPRLPDALQAVRAWGFDYQSFIVWQKVFASGKVAMGPGYRVRTMAELIIVATVGKPTHAPFPGLFRGIRREHSRKPDEFYRLVEMQAPTLFRRADLFSRQERHGWRVWGDETGKFAPASRLDLPRAHSPELAGGAT